MGRARKNLFKTKPLLLSLIEVLARVLGVQSDRVYDFGFLKEIWCRLIHSIVG